MTELSEALRQVMRQWPSGVAVVTSRFEEKRHGMTVSSFNSISLNPPLVTITLAQGTRTADLVRQSGIFGISILSEDQQDISERFAGNSPENEDRFKGLETLIMSSGIPFLADGIGFLDCKVIHHYPMSSSTLFVGEVLAARWLDNSHPLIYLNRSYHKVNHDR